MPSIKPIRRRRKTLSPFQQEELWFILMLLNLCKQQYVSILYTCDSYIDHHRHQLWSDLLYRTEWKFVIFLWVFLHKVFHSCRRHKTGRKKEWKSPNFKWNLIKFTRCVNGIQMEIELNSHGNDWQSCQVFVCISAWVGVKLSEFQEKKRFLESKDSQNKRWIRIKSWSCKNS